MRTEQCACAFQAGRLSITAAQLRQDLYRLLDHILATGEPLEIDRKGRRLRIVAEPPTSRLERLVPHTDFINGDPEGLAELDWNGN